MNGTIEIRASNCRRPRLWIAQDITPRRRRRSRCISREDCSLLYIPHLGSPFLSVTRAAFNLDCTRRDFIPEDNWKQLQLYAWK